MNHLTSSIIITSFNESKTIGRAVDSFLNQTLIPTQIIVSAPDDETLSVADLHGAEIIRDPGKGKSYALNLLLKDKNIKSDILILSDGDCYVNDKAVESIVKMFEANSKVGCVSGRVIPTNDPTTSYGYFAHTLALGAHLERQRRWKSKLPLECTGYLFAFRRKLINQFPTDVAEDAIIPLIINSKKYKTAYVPEAIGYVQYPITFDDFVKQKIRTVKSHAKLIDYFPDVDKMKSFYKEIFRGVPILAKKTCREIGWTIRLMFIRFMIWWKARKDIKKKIEYSDGWDRVESTK